VPALTSTLRQSADNAGASRLYWALPRVALVAFFGALTALLWFVHQSELDEQRATLISDVLWVEQNLRFNLGSTEEQLREFGADLAADRITLEEASARLRLMLTAKPWLTQLLVIDGDGAHLLALPHERSAQPQGEAREKVPSTASSRLAASLGRTTYSNAYAISDRDAQVQMHVPRFRDGSYQGAVVAFISLRRLLDLEVPWWFAQKYLVAVEDVSSNALASKSAVNPGRTDLSYQVAFDPPGNGLVLRVVSYKAETSLVRNLLGAAIVLLAIAVLWSLWALRRHVLRRYEAEDALREEHAFRKAMEDSLVTGLRARDLSGRITYVNPAFCRMVGFAADELIGKAPPMPYWAPEEYARTREVHDRILAGQVPPEGVEVRLMRKSGERFDALIYEAPLIDVQGRQSGWMGSVLDITARKRAEELYRQQQEKLQVTARLVTMGEMASTLAHELNQPLAAISSYNTGCINKLETGDFAANELSQVLKKIGAQAQRAGAIIRRVHEFVRRSEPKLQPCELAPIIEDGVDLVDAEAKKRGVRILTQVSGGPLPVSADRVMVEQVLLNLIRNGMDAMGDAAPEDKQLLIRVDCDNAAAVVSVVDRGCGLSAATAERLYTPFFTTKVEGMGMGLNICRSIMELHKGRLWFEPNPDGGTIFRFSLPLCRP
jgi:two-component system sensor histidine kinase DctS